jgi:hypothetical protein
MAMGKFRSEALKNKYGSNLLFGIKRYFICFSGAEKFAAIFPAALTFSLVLSLVSRQEKEHTPSPSAKETTSSVFRCPCTTLSAPCPLPYALSPMSYEVRN